MYRISTLLPLFIFLFVSFTKSHALPRVNTPVSSENVLYQLDANDILNFSRKEIEVKVGRKLKFKERIALWIVKKKIKKQLKKSGNQDPENLKTDELAIISFAGGLFGFLIPFLGILGVIFGILSLIKINNKPKKFKGKGLAIAGIILGIIGTVVILAALSSIEF